MSDIIKNGLFSVVFSANKEFCVKSLKKIIIDFALRRCSFGSLAVSENDNNASACDRIAQDLWFPARLVHQIVRNFLLEINNYLRLITIYRIKRTVVRPEVRLRIYLHKLHRIAPVFDYRRARRNLTALLNLFDKYNFHPQVSTQLACIIYVTDKKSENDVKLVQRNVRAITGCSAYAFHKVRNILKIDALLKK